MQNYQDRTSNLLRKIQQDPDNVLLYRNQIVELNMKLVSHVLKKYKPYSEDQFQAGSIGLILAANTFKEDKEVPFHSYACFCIEREIHKAFRKQNNSFESLQGENIIYLDALLPDKRGGESKTVADLIPDTIAEEDFEKILDDYTLFKVFEKIVHPSIEKVAGITRGQDVKINVEEWKKLESRYILEMALTEGTQKSRFNLTQMAKDLTMSVQNIRKRHVRVLKRIQQKCIEEGYRKGD